MTFGLFTAHGRIDRDRPLQPPMDEHPRSYCQLPTLSVLYPVGFALQVLDALAVVDEILCIQHRGRVYLYPVQLRYCPLYQQILVCALVLLPA